MKRYRRHKNVY